MGIHNKLLNLQKEIKSVSKDGKIETRTGTYKILSHGKVMEITRPLFLDYDLVLYPTEYSMSREGNITSVIARYEIVDVESGERIAVSSVGQGHDTQDKGAGKASTYADKYLILRLLRLIQEEDPDLTASDVHDEKDAETKAKGEEAKDYLKAMLRDGIVDQNYFDNADGYLDYFIERRDTSSIDKAIAQMKKLKYEHEG